jgi:hypothetical protein
MYESQAEILRVQPPGDGVLRQLLDVPALSRSGQGGDVSTQSQKGKTMKHLSVLLIFWLSIWTIPKPLTIGGPLWLCWLVRAGIVLWGFYLCRKILNGKREY